MQISVNKNKFEVFILSTKIPIPFNFAVHTWVVTNKKGKVNRWEVWQFKDVKKPSWEHVHKNLMGPFIGMNKYLWKDYPRNGTKLITKVQGDEAKKIIDFVEKNASSYKFRDKYRYFPGPNSNTFTQWVLNQSKILKRVLPKNAFGKNYKN